MSKMGFGGGKSKAEGAPGASGPSRRGNAGGGGGGAPASEFDDMMFEGANAAANAAFGGAQAAAENTRNAARNAAADARDVGKHLADKAMNKASMLNSAMEGLRNFTGGAMDAPAMQRQMNQGNQPRQPSNQRGGGGGGGGGATRPGGGGGDGWGDRLPGGNRGINAPQGGGAGPSSGVQTRPINPRANMGYGGKAPKVDMTRFVSQGKLDRVAAGNTDKFASRLVKVGNKVGGGRVNGMLNWVAAFD